jgi:hypothetical protein
MKKKKKKKPDQHKKGKENVCSAFDASRIAQRSPRTPRTLSATFLKKNSRGQEKQLKKIPVS